MRLIKKANLRIKGTGNEFVCPKDVHNELLKYGNVRIDGNNNKINIGGPNYLKFTDIKIFGNNNTLILPPGCYGKLNLEIRTSDAVVTVGHKTGFMGTDIILEEKGSRVIIGDDCMFAKETRLYCSDFHAVIDLKPDVRAIRARKLSSAITSGSAKASNLKTAMLRIMSLSASVQS